MNSTNWCQCPQQKMGLMSLRVTPQESGAWEQARVDWTLSLSCWMWTGTRFIDGRYGGAAFMFELSVTFHLYRNA